LTSMLTVKSASSLSLRVSEIARSQLLTRKEARSPPWPTLHCNDLRSEHLCTQSSYAEPQAYDVASAHLYVDEPS